MTPAQDPFYIVKEEIQESAYMALNDVDAAVESFKNAVELERGISILQRIGVGIVFSGIAMVTAAIVEAKRLRIYDQVPDSMRSLGIGFYLSVIGASNFLSSLLIAVVDHVTEKAGGTSWFQPSLMCCYSVLVEFL